MEKHIRNKAWREWEREYAIADAAYQKAARRRKIAKDKLTALMESASLIPEIGSSCYAEGDVLQVRLTMSKGRTSFDKERLLADHPNIRRSNYETVGEPSLSFVAKVLPGAVLNPHEEEKVATAVA